LLATNNFFGRQGGDSLNFSGVDSEVATLAFITDKQRCAIAIVIGCQFRIKIFEVSSN
jgi:hypothetical protein